MEIEFGMDGSERSFIYEDSTERKLESMYLVISFYLEIPSLASFVCHNWLDCLGYKYILPFIVERFVIWPINKLYFFLAIYFSVVAFAIFFFCEFFELIKDASHSSDLICW